MGNVVCPTGESKNHFEGDDEMENEVYDYTKPSINDKVRPSCS